MTTTNESSKPALVAELIDALDSMIDWAGCVSDEYLEGEPGVRAQYREDIKDARELIKRARGV